MRLTAIGLGMVFMRRPGIHWPDRRRTVEIQDARALAGQAPGENGTIGDEVAKTKGDPAVITSLTNITKPTITVFRPEHDKNTGVAIMVCPGGGYSNLAWDHEGEQVGRWLKSIGVTAAVLKYRVPRRPDTAKGEPPIQALMDAQPPSAWSGTRRTTGLDTKRIGILGFSAGGHLGAWASTNYDKRSYERSTTSIKSTAAPTSPSSSTPAHPPGRDRTAPPRDSGDLADAADVPGRATDDRPLGDTVFLYLALKRAGVPVECHLYTKGGHGFGMRPATTPAPPGPALRGVAPRPAHPQAEQGRLIPGRWRDIPVGLATIPISLSKQEFRMVGSARPAGNRHQRLTLY